MDALDVKQAHVVGHSFSTLVTVRLAVDARRSYPAWRCSIHRRSS
jgi:pimeloyl-ACP methyl ester carboxylesterase